MKKILLLLFVLLTVLHLHAQEGLLDPSFGINGSVKLGQRFVSTAFTKEGKLVGLVPTTSGFTLYRYDKDGTPDASFGSNGVVTSKFNLEDQATVVTIDSSGNIMVGGFTLEHPFTLNGLSFAFAYFNNTGTRTGLILRQGSIRNNESIGPLAVSNNNNIIFADEIATGGGTSYNIVNVNTGNTFEFYGSPEDLFSAPYSFAFSNDGKMLIGGYEFSRFPAPRYYLLLQRFKSDNTRDSSFGINGIVKSPVGEGITNLAIQNDQKILGSWLNQLFRFNTNASFDASFGTNGIVNTAININKIVIQSDGKIVVGGTLNGDFALARYNTDGTLDPTFGNGGMTTTDFGGTESIENMIISGNRLYVYGNGILAAYKLGTTCTPPTFLNSGTIVLDASCGNNDGQISIIPTSGTASFMYSIDGGLTYKSGANTGSGFTNLAAGTYKLRLKDAKGCESEVVEKTVRTIYGGPTFTYKTSEATCGNKNGSITIIPSAGAGSGAGSFMYSIDGGMTYVAGPSTGYTFSNLAANTYYLRVKNATGCESAIIYEAVKANFSNCTGATVQANITALEMAVRPELVNPDAIKAYPNPTKGQFKLQLKNFMSQKAEVSIFNGEGKLVQKRQLSGAGTNTVDFDLTGRAKGIYYIKITTNSGTRTSKVTLQ